MTTQPAQQSSPEPGQPGPHRRSAPKQPDRLLRAAARVATPWSLRKQDWAYQQLRERILAGALAPGEQLSQEALASELGISRGPLRDALSRLAAEKLVVDRPHQKTVVADVSLQDARDIYNGRAALESMLAAAAAQANPGDRHAAQGALTLLLEQQGTASSWGDTVQVRWLDRQFHDTIYALAGMPASVAALDQLRAKSDRYIALYLSDAYRAQTSVDEHAAILSALASGDAEQSATLTRAHVLGGLCLLTGSIDGQQPAGVPGTP
ncbi:GntR family transcriptional regulator [Streptomyces malaysiensis]|uniref:GntR family transcriptional regulator n=1 Tax=Streptomyces malaysiensis TaxID=92644 RepID=A0A7X6B1B4_STRMQ|nr:GntR family transcriptional regulator [Streptomyces malaysiensis]NIY69396.1 GntR family transcriptional regulator [Streptomyces malaysiensis]